MGFSIVSFLFHFVGKKSRKQLHVWCSGDLASKLSSCYGLMYDTYFDANQFK